MGITKQDGLSSQSNTMKCGTDGKLLVSQCETSQKSSFGHNVSGGNFNERGKTTDDSLQDAFLKFKRSRQKKLKRKVCLKKKKKRNEEIMKELRMRFVEQAKKYLGVPYARRYHEPNSPEYDAPLFLDCCGLVRRVLRDLREDFGFNIGSWNQAYMFDTLPINVKDVNDMKPGDLVFVSGVFNQHEMRKQRHNIVHVEIWAGDGEQTIGARWKRGRLQIHDSYQYVSKSYHSMVYHFKSIDTWLKGICKSFCPEHVWKSSSFTPGKRSIFAIPESDKDAEDCIEENLLSNETYVCAVHGPEDDETLLSENCTATQLPHMSQAHVSSKNNSEKIINLNCKSSSEEDSVECCPDTWIDRCFCDSCEESSLIIELDELNNELITADRDLSIKDVVSHPNGGRTGGENNNNSGAVGATKVSQTAKGLTRKKSPNDDDDQSNNRRPTRPLCRPTPSYTRLNQQSPTFFIGGHNGAKMVEATLTSLGWKRIHDSNDRKFYLKWVECKKNLDFSTFREGEQLVNHIPNGNLLTTKIGLLTSLEKFERVSSKIESPTRSKTFQMKDFFPETYKLERQEEIDQFIHHIYQDGEVWICKPTGMNQGKGIFLIRDQDELEKRFSFTRRQGRQKSFSPPGKSTSYPGSLLAPPPGRVVQRYISNPLLLNGFKADIRTYMLIAGTCPYMVFYHAGYVRLSVIPYSLNQEEIHAHLTNQYIQKKHPLYQQVKEETVWSLEKLQEYINETYNKDKTMPRNWVCTTFTKRMQEIMLKCFDSVRHKLERKLGFFDLLGFDFMLDENFKVWLIEINVNPALHTNCKILSDLIPQLVDDTLRLVIEVFEKSKNKERLTALENIGKFQLLYNGEKK